VPAPSTQRDLRLDFFRGVSLILIFVDHIPENVLSLFTLQSICFFDAAEVFRLLKPGGTHLIWALDAAPSNIALSPASLAQAFVPGFKLSQARKSRRRLAASHWYWLTRSTTIAEPYNS